METGSRSADNIAANTYDNIATESHSANSIVSTIAKDDAVGIRLQNVEVIESGSLSESSSPSPTPSSQSLSQRIGTMFASSPSLDDSVTDPDAARQFASDHEASSTQA